MATRVEQCAVCGKGEARERTREVEIQPFGRRVKFKRREWQCPTCGESYVDDAQGAANDRAELSAKAGAVREVGGAELRAVRDIAGVTQPELETILGLGKNTVARWETGQRPVPGYIAALVRVLALNPTALRELAAVARVELPAAEAPARAAASSRRG